MKSGVWLRIAFHFEVQESVIKKTLETSAKSRMRDLAQVFYFLREDVMWVVNWSVLLYLDYSSWKYRPSQFTSKPNSNTSIYLVSEDQYSENALSKPVRVANFSPHSRFWLGLERSFHRTPQRVDDFHRNIFIFYFGKQQKNWFWT